MRPAGLLKQVVMVFAVALVFYAAAFWAIEHRRNRLGPWQVAFVQDSSGSPEILINQPNLAITNVCIAFTNATVPAAHEAVVVEYTQPRAVPFPVPFGRCLFMDTTTLPGTLVLELFGHEIQLMPRALTVDKHERPWQSGESIGLPSANGVSNAPVRP